MDVIPQRSSPKSTSSEQGALPASKASPCKRGPKARFTVPAAKCNSGKAWGPPPRASPQANPTHDAAWASDIMMLPARFCFWELTEQLPRVVTHPGIAPASHSLNFGVLTTPKPVSSQKASSRVVTHPGIALVSNSLNFGVPTNPKPVSSQKASCYEDARCAI
ncbi:hypothetical protein L3X38_027247 [Prunus dulcis]|uniref:Uncharacterized protein n=1 Tax=Prunus dulcis TaxID=3755 RepID=A0AAD4VNG9_PRUDU|nr:hypothetical protein L3X38_027247 [Prunus dulcis]